MQSRLTINVNCSYVKDWQKTLTFLKALDPVTVIAVIDTLSAKGRVLEIKQALPHAKIIARCVIVVNDNGQQKELDGALHLAPQGAGDTNRYIVSPGNFLDKWGELGKDGLTLSYFNEPQTADASQENIGRMVMHMIETINLALQRGISLLVGNFGVGQSPLDPKTKQWDARFDDVLTLISRHPEQFSVGIHLYSPVDTFNALDALIARCKAIPVPVVPCVVSEFGFDTDGSANGLNGYKSRGYSGVQFGGWCVDKIKNVYGPYFQSGTLDSVAVFGWGYAASFPAFDVETDTDWQATILDAHAKGLLSMPTKPLAPDYTPSTFTAGDKYTLQSADGARTNVRTAPIVSADNLMPPALDDKTVVKLLEVQQVGVDWWYRISSDTVQSGWLSGRGGRVTFTPIPVAVTPPPPVVPPPVIALPPPVVAKPYPEVSASYARRMASTYKSLAESYKLMSENSLDTSAQWEALANVIDDLPPAIAA